MFGEMESPPHTPRDSTLQCVFYELKTNLRRYFAHPICDSMRPKREQKNTHKIAAHYKNELYDEQTSCPSKASAPRGTDLLDATDHRVQLPLLRELREVHRHLAWRARNREAGRDMGIPRLKATTATRNTPSRRHATLHSRNV